jgi:hypothetical protein
MKLGSVPPECEARLSLYCDALLIVTVSVLFVVTCHCVTSFCGVLVKLEVYRLST